MGYILRLLLPVAAFLALVFGLSRRASPDDAIPRVLRGSQPSLAQSDLSGMGTAARL